MKPSDPLLLADGTLRCGMYPAGKVVAISWHLATPRFPQFDHTVGKISAVAAQKWNLWVLTYDFMKVLKSLWAELTGGLFSKADRDENA